MLHQPVLLTEAVNLLAVKSDGLYLDATFGHGGHSQAILASGAKVIGLDYDQSVIDRAQNQFAAQLQSGQLKLIRANFNQLDNLADLPRHFDGILFDLGTNIDQLTSADKGLSFQSDSPLDMRLETGLAVTASDMLNFLSVKELTRLLKEYGGEEESSLLAKVIKLNLPITTTKQLADLIVQNKTRKTKLHPATKVFQALRIAVNSELDNIAQALPQAFNRLNRGGRLVCIAFHEGEDRIVKHYFLRLTQQKSLKILTNHPVTPTDFELARNSAARSAKLRAGERIR